MTNKGGCVFSFSGRGQTILTGEETVANPSGLQEVFI
jgi:hypothetical protein